MKRFASAVSLMAAVAMAASPVLASSYRSPGASRISSYSPPARTYSSPAPARFTSPSPAFAAPRANRITAPPSTPTPSSPPRASLITPPASGGLNLAKSAPAPAAQNSASRITAPGGAVPPVQTAQNHASRIPFTPSPSASRFAASPQYRTYTTHVHVYTWAPGGSYHYHYAPLLADPYYGALHYGSAYHYGAYDYMPVLAAAGVLTAILAVDAAGQQHRIDCNVPVTQADFDTCASARQSLGVPAAYAAPANYAAPVAAPVAYSPAPMVVHQGMGLAAWIVIILLIGALGTGGLIAYRRLA